METAHKLSSKILLTLYDSIMILYMFLDIVTLLFKLKLSKL